MIEHKIFVFTIPASGHVNPLLPVLREIAKNQHIEVTVFLTEEFRSKFQSSGVKFKLLKNFDFVKRANLRPFGKSRYFELLDLATCSLEAISHNFEYIAKEIDQEKPSLIIYDTFGIYIKWAMEYYVRKSKKLVYNWPLPPMIGFAATFIYNESIYPNQIEKSLIFPYNFRFFYDCIRIFLASFKISLYYGISFINPFKHLKMKIDSQTKMIMSVTFPELHPRSHLYDSNIYKFCGSTIQEESLSQIYANQMQMEPFKSLFDLIQITSDKYANDIKLVLVSLGTLFNNNLDIFKKIIDAFENFDIINYNSHVNLSRLRVVISTGDKCYETFQNLVNTNRLKVNDNIFIVRSSPQVEVLKRASLFVTHCGMNSTSESIHYGVPMICIPLSEDQPAVAYRVADELGLGIRLDYTKMKFYEISKAINKILTNESYYHRSRLYSKLSKAYIGYKQLNNIIIKYLNKL
uniref:UDP-glucuronosyltransferase-like protein 2 n=1 Tax=Brachionus rotundiformis TaxID=96890 RepID=A0A7H9SQT7_9BILA|nr:UDP-glucuronosyltransferase-like protein 2 [Brachionus rotundiformis]